MPDETDIAIALVATVRAALSGQTFAGWTARTYRGWPQAARLTTDSNAKIANVSVFPRAGMWRDVTRYGTEWHAVPQPCLLTVTLDGDTATFAGSCQMGQCAALQVGRTGYPYRIQPTDTPAIVAQALAVQIDGATVAGASVTHPDLTDAQTGSDAIATRETRRQQQQFMVSVWTSEAQVRDAVSAAVDAALSSLTNGDDVIRPFLTTADGTLVGPVAAEGSASYDKAQDSDVYRRDFYYRVEYPSVQRRTQPVMLLSGLVLPIQGVTVRGLASTGIGDDAAALVGADGVLIDFTASEG